MYTTIKNTFLILSTIIVSSCSFHQGPLHFAQDLKAQKLLVAPGKSINLTLRLPSKITSSTDAVLYESMAPTGPFRQLPERPTIVSQDTIAFKIPTRENEGGERFYQATFLMSAHPGMPYMRSDIEKVIIKQPQETYLQVIHFGKDRHEALAPIYLCTGGSRQLELYGGYADGVVRPLTSHVLGTTYEVVNPPYYRGHNIRRAVVDVSKDGYLEAFNAGMATLLVTNGAISNSRDIIVDDCDNVLTR